MPSTPFTCRFHKEDCFVLVKKSVLTATVSFLVLLLPQMLSTEVNLSYIHSKNISLCLSLFCHVTYSSWSAWNVRGAVQIAQRFPISLKHSEQ